MVGNLLEYCRIGVSEYFEINVKSEAGIFVLGFPPKADRVSGLRRDAVASATQAGVRGVRR
jgi:hypothetical protein